MKKYIIAIVVLFSLVLPDVTMGQNDGCVILKSVDLRYRARNFDTNGEVSHLQDFLQSQNYLHSEPTGYFGLLTLKAVKDFQQNNGLLPTGYVGPLTKALIQNASCGNTKTEPHNPNSTISIDRNTLVSTSSLPTISGYAYIEGPLRVSISNSGGRVWQSGDIGVNSNRWSVTVNQLLPSGLYSVQLYSNGVLAATESLTILYNTMPPVKISYPTAGLRFRADAPLQIGFSSPVTSALFGIKLIGRGYYYDFGEFKQPEAGSKLNLFIPQSMLNSVSETFTDYEFQIFYKKTYIASSPRFAIAPPSAPQPLKVVTPNGGGIYFDQNYKITWIGDRLEEGTVSISVRSSDGDNPTFRIVENAMNNGSYNWIAGKTMDGTIPSGYYIVKVCAKYSASDIECDETDANFKMVNSSKPALKVVSPNDGGNYKIGDVLNISWDPIGLPYDASFLVEIQDISATQSATIGTSKYLNSVLWVIPKTLTGLSNEIGVGRQYKIKVTYRPSASAGLSDISDIPFTIDSNVGSSRINIISPHGGENWEYRSKQNISWFSTGINASSPLTIQLERKLPTDSEFRNIGTIATAQPHSGSYNWTVADLSNQYLSGSQFRLLIGRLEGTPVVARSDAFSITLPEFVNNVMNDLVAASKIVVNRGIYDLDFDFNNDGRLTASDTSYLYDARAGGYATQEQKNTVFNKVRNIMGLVSNNYVKYMPELDFNRDGIINVADVAMVTASFPGAVRSE